MRQDYLDRRRKLANQLPEGAIAFIPAATEQLRNGDAHYRFRQDSDFYYLTGFNEPDALLALRGGDEPKAVLFNRPNNPAEEQWTGRRLGQDRAKEVLGIDEAWPIANLSDKLPDLIEGCSSIYYPFGRYPAVEKQVFSAVESLGKQVRRGIKAPGCFSDLSPLLGELRLFKQPSEIGLMKRAADISVAAHQRAMKQCKHLQYEYQIEAELLYEFSRQGCRSVAYDPIIGCGANACILHYNENNQPLVPGELLLIDAGGEYAGYAADITRTFPVNGRFSAEQRAIYALVLSAQKAGIAVIKPGVAWNEVQRVITRILTTGLCELGILKGEVDALLAAEAYRPFYPHNSGHWLGLDVHDSGAYKKEGQWRVFEAGMVLTVEPGLYLSAGMNGVDARWWTIGVRIEDDILVTETGHENLTEALPVEIDEIEAFMRD